MVLIAADIAVAVAFRAGAAPTRTRDAKTCKTWNNQSPEKMGFTSYDT